MSRSIRTVVGFASGFILLSFVVLVVNQTAQVVQLASTIHPRLGAVTLWTLLGAYSALAGAPLVMVLRLPKPLVPPESDASPEFPVHLQRLGERLAASPHLEGRDLSDRPGIEGGLRTLSERSDEIIRDTAASIFIATAVSQSGRLDALLVLAAQSRMVWRIAHLYQQRPTVRDVAHLYANVAATAFIATELQDLDLGEQVEPILASAVGALGASVPGFQVAGALLANCVLSGSANAFLTLRVGMIAKRHCGAVVLEPKSVLRKAATAEAARHLGSIVAAGTGRISKAMWLSSVGKVGGAVSKVSDQAKGAGARLWAKIGAGRAGEQAEMA
jgi:hypothetical protein